MGTAPRAGSGSAVRAVLVLVVLALVGGAVAVGVQSALGLRVEPGSAPTEVLRAAPARDAVLPPRVDAVRAPSDPRLDAAVAELRAATQEPGRTRGSATLQVSVRDDAPTAGTDDGYTLTLTGARQRRSLRLEADTTQGAVRGTYELAAAAREGRPVDALAGAHPPSRLPFRMVDLGAAAVTPDPTEWAEGTDYSHVSGAFRDVLLPDAPYVDQEALAVAEESVNRYVDHVLAQGYNAVAVPGLLEYLTFADVPAVYADDPDHVDRAEAVRAALGPLWERAAERGLRVYLRTDMLALTPPLRRLLVREHDLDTESPALWEVYTAGLDELYREMPYLSGIVLRIGEAGDVYDQPGLAYTSELAVTSVAGVRAMLTALTDQAERSDRELVFRTWSVGVGAVGDMHTDADSYEAVLGGIESEHLVVSTKYSLGDFYSHLPLNHTLESGAHRRIVELQSRREFEGQGALPDDLGVLHQQALQHLLRANPRIEGVWTWTQDGGPWRAGPMLLLLEHGFWQLYDLNSQVAARLAVDPEADVAELTAGWARRWFSDDAATVRAIGEAMALSRKVVTEGLYVGPYADNRVRALGLEPPPMMWVFEWDILTGDSAALDLVYEVTRDGAGVATAVAEGRAALDGALRMRDLVAGTDPSTWRDPALRRAFVDALDFQVSLLEVLGSYRTMVLRHAEWLDGTGRREAWSQARTDFLDAADEHESRYTGDLALPAWNLTAARIGLDRAERDLPDAWAARVLLVLVLVWLLLGALGARSPVRVPAARATWVASTRPWRAVEATAGLGRVQRALVVAVPLTALLLSRVVFTWAAAPAHLLAGGLAWLGAVLATGVALALLRRDPWPVLAAVGGAVLLRVLLLAAALAPRGPGGYWFAFWTAPGRRSAYVVLAVVLAAWVVVAAVWALRPGLSRRRCLGLGVAVTGGSVAAPAVVVAVVGLERALSTWNDQLALLPWGLARILGLTTYLGIPSQLAWWAAGAGAVLLAAGAVLALPLRSVSRGRSAGSPAR